ncbi:MAG: hypothetical protein A3B68_00815 [Candidatus Melainabacteria bacterium RIFCSPHIGHO2_02_FULL_34_12]|nr:MAG: hypothetical protein A3B68_00815 [Candidatus Melainabacteria bacterium RIFCSPHIGHO2_02_FULL_34_12]
MGYEVINTEYDSEDESINNAFDRIFNRASCKSNNFTKQKLNNIEEDYFNIKIMKKEYPSCYQYNVLIMLAKRLLEEENKLAYSALND